MYQCVNWKVGILAFFCCFLSICHVSAKDIGWGIPKSENHEQPWPGQEYDDIIRQNDAYYIGSPDEKMIYLTFDCGYENGNTPLILDVLKEHQVPALFFVTGHFMEEHPELVKRMVDEGHIVGNHTWYHPDLAKVSKEKFNEELQLIEDKYEEIIGQEMLHYLRPPEGHFNQQMLDWAKERGYYTILWSLAYMDWDVNKQKGADYAYEQILARIHPGAIILMHSISSDNAESLNTLIPELRNEGYEFKSIQYLMTKDNPVVIE
ncbi:MAG: delta-lactam-biosynthetic de-N-acetylase [Turicibacter sp.]|nr:delta-lactam-biosynthetic de-N-acetylase [Turicibacter sp.]